MRHDADARIAAAEEVASTAAAAPRLSGWAGGAEEALRSKIRTMDAAQDGLLAEIDAATGELERLDAELDATEERARAAEEREREALDGVAAAAMKTDRLMEMLTEQEEWGGRRPRQRRRRRGKGRERRGSVRIGSGHARQGFRGPGRGRGLGAPGGGGGAVPATPAQGHRGAGRHPPRQ